MNKIRNDFPRNVKDFFIKLQNYIDTDLYFYGSVNRNDYIHNQSDIDIAIFTDNEDAIISKLQHFLHVKKNDFKKLVWKLHGEIIYGYKIKCDEFINLKCEIAIYNNEFKDVILADMKRDNVLPLHVWCLLFILKTLYYTFSLLSTETYSQYKRYIYNYILHYDKHDSIFYLIT